MNLSVLCDRSETHLHHNCERNSVRLSSVHIPTTLFLPYSWQQAEFYVLHQVCSQYPQASAAIWLVGDPSRGSSSLYAKHTIGSVCIPLSQAPSAVRCLFPAERALAAF